MNLLRNNYCSYTVRSIPSTMKTMHAINMLVFHLRSSAKQPRVIVARKENEREMRPILANVPFFKIDSVISCDLELFKVSNIKRHARGRRKGGRGPCPPGFFKFQQKRLFS